MHQRSPAEVFLTGLSPETGARLAAALKRDGLIARFEPWSDAVPLVVEGHTFDVVIVGHPLPGAGFGQLLSSVRARASACRRSGMVILVPPADVPAVERLIGRGVNRVLPDTVSEQDVLKTVLDLFDVAPRRPIHLPVQLEVNIASRDFKALCQTENISESGMLLRGLRSYPPGTVFSFEMTLPENGMAIRGTAEITRNTDAQREPIQGVGARFVNLEGDDLGKLEHLLMVKGDVDGVN